MSCHDYEGVMSVLCTPLQVKCYQKIYTMEVNGTRNCLVTDILLNIRKSAEWTRKW